MKLHLSHGCSCSQVKVYPHTWERPNATIKKDWYIWYRFYDPTFPNKQGHLKIIKGMNEFKTLKERQAVTRDLLEQELRLLQRCDYNPITGIFTEPSEPAAGDYIIHPDTGLVAALQEALKRLDIVETFRSDIGSNLRYLKTAAEQLRMDQKPVKDIKRRHMVMLLDQCGKNKDIWTAATYNRYRRNISCIFRELIKIQAIEHNPIDGYLEQKKGTKKKKEILTAEHIQLINTKLRKINYRFWRLIHIFCNSGSRTTELMKVRVPHVDLKRQMVTYTIKKGEVIREVERPIKSEVLYLWEQLMVEAKKVGPEAYLFSENLSPGKNHIRVDQIRHRWRNWVQRDPDTRAPYKSGRKMVYPRPSGLGIKVPWYRLKHLNSDLMDKLYGSDIAAHLNQHNKTMVENVYAVGREDRKNEVLKGAPNPLALTALIPEE